MMANTSDSWTMAIAVNYKDHLVLVQGLDVMVIPLSTYSLQLGLV